MGSADPIQVQSITPPLKMGTKMKGLLKGLRYISQIFDEEKDQEIQIGFPTDVKHVAHIGWDGPAVENPSWMKEFKAPGQCQSAPLDMLGAPKTDNPDVKWVSQDSNHRSTRSEDSTHRSTRSEGSTKDVPKTRHRHRSMENAPDPESLGKDPSIKSRHSRRHQSKGSSEGSSRGRHSQDLSTGDEKKLPEIPKKTRRKKSKEDSTGGGSSRPSFKSKANDSESDALSDSTTPSGGTVVGSKSKKQEVSQNFVQEEGGRANSGIMT